MSTRILPTIALSGLAFFTVYSINAYAHPNHMSFENVQHEAQNSRQTSINNTDKLLHDNQEHQHRHGDLIPCKEQQHKASPCKKK